MGIDYNKRPSKGAPEPEATPPAPPAPPAGGEGGSPLNFDKPGRGTPPAPTPPAPTPQAAPTPPAPTPQAAPAASGGAVSLTKRGQTVSLKKGASGGPVRINLNWQQRPPAPAGGGLFKKMQAAAAGNIDLDLGCLFELADGRKGVVQALGNAFGDLNGPPFIKLDKDDRSGTSTDGENLLLSEQHAAEIKRIVVFAFIYEGAPNWSKAGGVVTIHSGGDPVWIKLDEARDGVGMCAICTITGGPAGFTVERQVQYVQGHKQLDEAFGWGMNWVRGSK